MEPTFIAFNASDAVLLASSGVSALMLIAAAIWRRRRRTAGIAAEGESARARVASIATSYSRAESTTSPPARASWGFLSLEAAEALIGRRLSSVKPVRRRCTSVAEAVLRETVAPKGFAGRWRCCRLGCGGWGCVYRCERGGIVVAFKVPRGYEAIAEGGVPPTVSETLMRRVAELARAVSRLRHPHLLQLLGFSERMPLLVYEYADMGTLEDQLAAGWRPRLQDVVLLGAQLADALRYIHGRGLVHGDIKSTNVFLVGGVVKLGDFSGLTKLLASTSRAPWSSYTPGWRAPEQVYSDLRQKATELGVENRIDVYQLGNLLLYLLAGETLDGEDRVDEDRLEEVLSRARISHERLRSALWSMLQLEPWRRPNAEEAAKTLATIYAEL